MTFYFYDLETSGFSPRHARILQFGGQRTDMDLNPVGEPHNFYIKLSEDILPDPDAALVTGITPQQTLKEGITEAEFLKVFYQEAVRPNTIFVGFNNIRFDDEFMRFLHFRNFYDAYEWHWKDGRSRWDLLDVTRMTRALRPDGIKWPINSEGISSNQLTLLTGINKLDHANAHDALGDVFATIDFARLLKAKQPQLFSYLLTARKKEKVAALAKSGKPFLYTSGKYPSEFEKTTVVQTLAENPNRQGVVVYDLRVDPLQFRQMTPSELAAIWRRPEDENDITLPVKTLQFNRCPAIAPLDRLDGASEKRLGLNKREIANNTEKLADIKEWPANILKALDILNNEQQTRMFEQLESPDGKLYDGFFGDRDRQLMESVRQTSADNLSAIAEKCEDQRLKDLIPLYKARNFPGSLNSKEKQAWINYCRAKLLGKNNQFDYFCERIKTLKEQKLTKEQLSTLKDVENYAESLKIKFS